MLKEFRSDDLKSSTGLGSDTMRIPQAYSCSHCKIIYPEEDILHLTMAIEDLKKPLIVAFCRDCLDLLQHAESHKVIH